MQAEIDAWTAARNEIVANEHSLARMSGARLPMAPPASNMHDENPLADLPATRSSLKAVAGITSIQTASTISKGGSELNLGEIQARVVSHLARTPGASSGAERRSSLGGIQSTECLENPLFGHDLNLDLRPCNVTTRHWQTEVSSKIPSAAVPYIEGPTDDIPPPYIIDGLIASAVSEETSSRDKTAESQSFFSGAEEVSLRGGNSSILQVMGVCRPCPAQTLETVLSGRSKGFGLCRNFNANAYCQFGDKCSFAHGELERTSWKESLVAVRGH